MEGEHMEDKGREEAFTPLCRWGTAFLRVAGARGAARAASTAQRSTRHGTPPRYTKARHSAARTMFLPMAEAFQAK